MKRSKYYIRVMRPIFQRAILTVEAPSEQAAMRSALEQAESMAESDWKPIRSHRWSRSLFRRTSSMEATSKGWSEGMDVVGHVLKFGLPIQRVRIPPGQSVDPQAGSESCSGTGDCPVDA